MLVHLLFVLFVVHSAHFICSSWFSQHSPPPPHYPNTKNITTIEVASEFVSIQDISIAILFWPLEIRGACLVIFNSVKLSSGHPPP